MTDNGLNTDYFDIISRGLEAKTWRYSRYGVANAEHNRPFITQTIETLIGAAAGRTCLVVSGGPSLLRRRSLDRLKPIIDRFVVVAADGSLGHCLRADIIPNYVVSVDPDNPENPRIARWFGDENLNEEKLKDDYFRRQDLDGHFNANEIEKNQEQIRLVNAAGPYVKAVLSTSASAAVRKRCYESGMDVYWWNPIYDDVSDQDSVTRRIYRQNKAPCMNTGGNVGSTALIFAARVLQARRAIMLGMDFAYYVDTPIERTQYYREFLDFMSNAEISHAYKTIHNPFMKEDYYTDPAYYWYRESFLELAGGLNGCEIINATEGGILFGNGIIWKSVDEVIEMIGKEDS